MRLLLLLALAACRPEGPEKPEDTGEAPIFTSPPCEKQLWYVDADADGWGDAGRYHRECEQPPGTVDNGADCDDSTAAVAPYVAEVCNGVDDDCDTVVDGAEAADAVAWRMDADGDGFGDPDAVVIACDPPDGAVADASDCDDADPAVHPDGAETCNGLDDDCDGTIDEGEAAGALPWYADLDADGFGDASAVTIACTPPEGTVSDATDCDDTSAAVHPGALEFCNATDDDCDGATDEDAADASTWYADTDGDGFGDATAATEACSPPLATVSDATDCDDTSADAHPGAVEACNTTDDDCDGATDEPDAADAPTWHSDADGDGYGDAAVATSACEAPFATVADATDCDDASATVHPGAVETCDTTDEDCDGAIDEDAADRSTWYADADGDGYGDPAVATLACLAPPSTTSDATDCDDSSATVSPGGSEVCNAIDDDCDGIADDGASDAPGWYTDADGDGHGDGPSGVVGACTAPPGTAAVDGDCDEADPGVHPGAVEVCDDGVDQDCDLRDACAAATEVDLAAADVTLTEDGLYSMGMGVDVADLDGDGATDLLFSIPDTHGEIHVAHSPVVSGARSARSTWLGDGGYLSRSGFYGVAAGDLDGDGVDDAVSSYGNSYYSGWAVFVMADDGRGWFSHGRVPARFMAVADLDGDGADDLVTAYSPVSYVFPGPLASTFATSTAHASFDMTDGDALAVGDLDADGVADLVVGGARGLNVLLGPVAAGALGPSDADAWIEGTALAAVVGDVDGDGDGDLVRTEGASGDWDGYVRVFLDPAAGSRAEDTADVVLLGVGDDFGFSIDAGDVDLDGTDELLVGAPARSSSTDPGAAWLWYGAPSGTWHVADAALVLRGVTAGDGVGWSVALGDIDGDAVPEAIVGAPGVGSTVRYFTGAIYAVTP